MLSDEEKKAFESVKDMFSDVTIKDIDEQSITIYGVAMLDIIKVLTIVEKQSKKIEESKQKEKEAYNFGYRNGCNDTSKFNDKTFIRIDKIKAKIEEYKKQQKEEPDAYLCIKVLQSVLEKE